MELKQLYYECFPSVARYIAAKGGNQQEAEDIFQDALIIYYEKLQNGKLDIRQSEQAYIQGIARHLWFARFREKINLENDHDMNDLTHQDDKNISEKKLLKTISEAGRKCLELLKSFYYDKSSMKKIAENFGFGSERSATVQKYKCLEKVRESVKQKSLEYADFEE